MRAVWKYPVTDWGPGSAVRYEIEMPDQSTVLTLQNQGGVSTLWVEVDPSAPVVERVFEWVGTGHPIPDGGKYVGTAQVQGGFYVFHLYEVSA